MPGFRLHTDFRAYLKMRILTPLLMWHQQQIQLLTWFWKIVSHPTKTLTSLLQVLLDFPACLVYLGMPCFKLHTDFGAMNGEIRLLVTDEPIEFEKWPVQEFRHFSDQFRGICGLYLKISKKNRTKTTWHNWLDFETTSILTEFAHIFPVHCFRVYPKMKKHHK